jgi:hypothetical protein
MFKMPKKCVKYSIILCLFLCIILIKNKNNIENFLNMSLNTEFNEEGLGDVAYLDRHDVRCEGLVNQFQLNRKDGKYRYSYSCTNPDEKQKLIITESKATKPAPKPGQNSKDLLHAQIKCADPNDKAVGLVGFRYNAKGYYDYACGKIVDKTEEDLKKEKDDAEAKKIEAANKEAARIQFAKEMKASLPKEQGCYLMASETTGEKCKRFDAKSNGGKWIVDTYGYQKLGSFNNVEKCLGRPKQLEANCGDGHSFTAEYVQDRSSGNENSKIDYHTAPYNNDWEHGDKKGSYRRTFYLDGHDVNCGKNKFITDFKLKDLGKEYTYLYKCNDPETPSDSVAANPPSDSVAANPPSDSVAANPKKVYQRLLVLYKPTSVAHHINIARVELFKPNGKKIKLTPYKVSDANVNKNDSEQDAINELKKTLDGKDDTYFHSAFKDYHKYIKPNKYHTDQPRYISYTFPDNVDIDSLSIITRTSPKNIKAHNETYVKRFQGMRATIYPHIEYDIGKSKDPSEGYLFNHWFEKAGNNNGVGLKLNKA